MSPFHRLHSRSIPSLFTSNLSFLKHLYILFYFMSDLDDDDDDDDDDDEDDWYEAYLDKLLGPDRLKFPRSDTVRKADVLKVSRSDADDLLYLVPYRWWKEASDHCFTDGEIIKGIRFRIRSYHSASDFEAEVLDHDSEIYFDMEREFIVINQEGLIDHTCALLCEYMWSKALKWHSDNSTEIEDMKDSFSVEDADFPIYIRISSSQKLRTLFVKIRRRDNVMQQFDRACWIFDQDTGMVRLWDYTGRIIKIWDANEAAVQGRVQADDDMELAVISEMEYDRANEVALAFKAYGLVDIGKSTGEKYRSSSLYAPHASPLERAFRKTGPLGLIGIRNIGNTCFMNCIIQCLAHTPKLVDYFLGDFKEEINPDNLLGARGELALAFGDLLRKLWAPGRRPVDPTYFKSVLNEFAPRFAGNEQHDSQEFLAFLLDGLHEDLNRVRNLFAVETLLVPEDVDAGLDEVVADACWQNHLARKDSIVIDLFHGQYRSKLECPVCKRVSSRFEPFEHLSLPLPPRMRSMTVTVLSTDGIAPPSAFTVTVLRYGRCKDLLAALSTACSLSNEEELLLAEVKDSRIFHFQTCPATSLTFLRDGARVVAYRLPKESENLPLVVFLHEREDGKRFGIPLVTRISSPPSESQIRGVFVKLLRPFHTANDNDIGESDEDDTADSGYHGTGEGDNKDTTMKEAIGTLSDASRADDPTIQLDSGVGFQFHLTDERGETKGARIKFRKPLDVSAKAKQVNVLVSWSKRMMGCYDTERLTLLPEVCKLGNSYSKTDGSVSLYKCLEDFLKEEPLDRKNMWECPSCKEHRQAIKKLDLWRLPEILVIQLKRFSTGWFLENKLETVVHFPVHQLDLSGYIARRSPSPSDNYRLYAVANHHGGTRGGHYTAVVLHQGRWFVFDDTVVKPTDEDRIMTSAAYLLFYRRVSEPIHSPSSV